MKRTLALALVLLAVLAGAPIEQPAEAASYTLNTTAAQETVVTRARTEDNARACASVGLPTGCTQAQADAQSPGRVTIYANNGAWLLDILKAAVTEKLSSQQTADLATWEKTRATATQAQKDAACAALGLAAGCLP